MGTINPKTIKRFRKRKLNTWDWLKEYSSKELNRALKKSVPSPNLGNIKLFWHQKICFLLLQEFSRFLLFLDMGGGKTVLSLATLRNKKQVNKDTRAIVFVPYVTSVDTWIEQTEEHTPELKCVPLIGTVEENVNKLINEEGDLFVISYPSAVALCSSWRLVRKKLVKKRTSKKEKWNFTANDVRKLFSRFDMLIMDEIHHAKNSNSLTYRMCYAISTQCDSALGLTGTPFGKDVSDLWAEYNLIDFGKTLGPTLGFFRSCFFWEDENFWGGRIYTFRKRLLPVLERLVKNRSIRFDIKECFDMPGKQTIVRRVRPTEGLVTYYNKGVEKLEEAMLETGRKRVSGAYTQLRQLASGFMTVRGDDKSRTHILLDENPKLEVLEELVTSMPAGKKMVVFHDFIFTNKMISDRLTSMGVKHARVWGQQKDQIGELRKFKRDPECRVLVINCHSGSSSHNLQMANYVLFFEQPTSVIDKEQARRRCWRPFQKEKVFFYELIMQGTVDSKMLRSNKEGRDLLKDVIDGKRKIKKL